MFEDLWAREREDPFWCDGICWVEQADRAWEVLQLISRHPRQGWGAEAMQRLTRVADQAQVSLVLLAQADPERSPQHLSQPQLVAFYQRFGFVIETDWGTMCSMHREKGRPL